MQTIVGPQIEMAIRHGLFIRENFVQYPWRNAVPLEYPRSNVGDSAPIVEVEEKLLEGYVRNCLDFFKNTVKDIGHWKKPTTATTSYDFWFAYSCYLLLGILDDNLKTAVKEIHKLESQERTITGADAAIKAQQWAEKMLGFFRQHWMITETEQLFKNPPTNRPESEFIPIDEAIKNWASKTSEK